jgi:hypothetical protein
MCASAADPVGTELKNIASLRDWVIRRWDRLFILKDIRLGNVDSEDRIDLADLESGELKVETELYQTADLFFQRYLILARILRYAIDSKTKRLELGGRLVLKDRDKNLARAKLAHSFTQSVAINNLEIGRNDDRHDLRADLIDQFTNLPSLMTIVLTRPIVIGLEGPDRHPGVPC